jgi:hypothetical protein
MPPDTKRNGDRDKTPSRVVHVPRSVPAFYKRRKKRGNEIGQVLLNMGAIKPEQLREALRIQQETGGLIGAILDKMGACDAQAIAQALINQVQLTGQPETALAQAARENPSIIGLKVESKPYLTIALLVGADAFGLLVAGGIAQLLTIESASLTTRVLGGLAVTRCRSSTSASTRSPCFSTPSGSLSRPACGTELGSPDGSCRWRSFPFCAGFFARGSRSERGGDIRSSYSVPGG